jgi:plasmid stabilization system protein ParE
MSYTLHPRAHREVFDIIDHYKSASGSKVAGEFFDELKTAVENAAANPTRHHFDLIANCRRVELQTFPYHFLYELKGELILIFVIRHNKRRPTFGLRRKR